METETYTQHLVTIPVVSEVDTEELRDIMIGISDHIIEWIEQQCIEADIDRSKITVTSCEMIKGE